jgi:type I restriction enzyme M protein
MLNTATKKRIDDLRDILVGKVPDPKSQVEQITIALIYKFMDDMDAEAEELGGKRKFFSGKYEHYSWKKLLDPSLSGHEVLNLYAEAIQQMNMNSNIPQLFRDIFKNAILPYRDPETLKSFLKIIDDFNYDHSEKLGDAFEYLLLVLGSQGDAGQFRTPRHIIDFMVYLVDPQKNETILDPACGTAGFLISSYKHIVKYNSTSFNQEQESNFNFGNGDSVKYNGDKLTPDERKQLAVNIQGYDISPDMVRLSLVNLYLHGFTNPRISEYDSLTSEERWNEHADVIIANPPFMSPKGGIKPHKRFSLESKRSEVLFVDYIAEHLTPNGRAAVIVPEGIIFQSGTAYKNLRKMLVEKYLYAVVSLPAGVFNPYSGVKTSILLMDKTLARRTDKILFAKVENDGYDLGAQRRANNNSDLPAIAKAIKEYVKCLNDGTEFKVEDFSSIVVAAKEKIGENGDWNLIGERYQISTYNKLSTFPYASISDFSELITKGTTPTSIGFEFENEGVNYIKIESITREGHLIPGKFAHISIDCHEKLERSQLKSGDILFSIAGAFGRVAIVDSKILPANTNQALSIIRINKRIILPSFLSWMLKSEVIFNEVQKLKVGVAQYNLSLKQVGELKIPLPPLEIQKEIVADIEGWQKIIDGARQVVENYKPQIEIDPIWPMVELGEIITLQRGYDLPKNKFIYGNYPVIGSNGIIGYHNEFKHQFPGVITGRSGTIGKVHFIEKDYWPHNTSLFVKEFNGNVPKFIYYLLQSIDLKSLGDGVSAVPSLDRKNAHKVKVFLPPLEKQKTIVDQLDFESQIIGFNKELITIFEQKIKNKISKVWGE